MISEQLKSGQTGATQTSRPALVMSNNGWVGGIWSLGYLDLGPTS